MKSAIVFGAGGFIGSHLVKRLKSEGFWVRGIDLKHPEFSATEADDFWIADLRDQRVSAEAFDRQFDEVYQLAADMGGAGYIFTGENDADIMHNSATINLNVLEAARQRACTRVFYSSSACIYPAYNQEDPNKPNCAEASAYPAAPDSEYGWEKLFSERLYLAYAKNHGMQCKIARYHNIFGPEGTWKGGKEKAPAALCRKIAETEDNGSIDVWGPGTQTRSFLFIDECIEGTTRLLRSDKTGPYNIGSEEMISINDLARLIADMSGKTIAINNIPGPIGVNGRNSDNSLIDAELGWKPTKPLKDGLEITYDWISQQVASQKGF